MTADLDLRPLLDVAALPASLEALVRGWISNDPIVGDATRAATAIALYHEHLGDALDLAAWGAPTGVPLPLLVSPGELRAHLRRVVRATCDGLPGRGSN